MTKHLKPDSIIHPHAADILVTDDGEGLVREGRVRVPKKIFSIYLNQSAVALIERVCAITGASKNAWIQLAISEKLMRDSAQ